jgi:hypothetical protein
MYIHTPIAPRMPQAPLPLSDYLFLKSTVINEIYEADKLEKPTPSQELHTTHTDRTNNLLTISPP